MDKRVVIITSNLTNDFMSPREKFLKVNVNVGMKEIHRLMGEGDNYSYGPLPQYLQESVQAKREGEKILHVLLRDLHDPDDPLQQPELIRFGKHNIKGTEGAEFVPPILDTVPHSVVINIHTLSLPVYDFHQVMNTFIGKDILTLSAEERKHISFIITGVYSNILVLNIASKIRNEYVFPNVFVSPHLVASKYPEAHLSALQIDFPDALVHVIPGLQQIYERTNIKREVLNLDRYGSCRIEPKDVAGRLGHDPRTIIENIFMFHDSVRIKSLSGGFSGGLLFIVRGEKRGAKTEPEILKIDRHENMQKEIQGYDAVKDFLGKNVPSFSRPVSYGKYTGIKMELASMEGEPETLQSLFEKIRSDQDVEDFLVKFKGLLKILKTKLYENTKYQKKIYPYKEFGLHSEQQKIWLEENIRNILPDTDLQSMKIKLSDNTEFINPLPEFDSIRKHVDRFTCDISVCHGDLNFANSLCDAKGNIWTIDWTYAGENPIELDFAKMENDIKFVMSKGFTEVDLPYLRTFEAFILQSMLLPDIQDLPEALFFVKNDLRFYKIYSTLQLLRQTYLSFKIHQNHALYKIALLKYATHTLSFDKRRGRGECSLPQLKYALLSVFLLIDCMVHDDLHQNIKKDKPDAYPVRFPIPKDKSSWDIDYPEYNPPYYVDPLVLANDSTVHAMGWADPEDWTRIEALGERKSLLGKMPFDLNGKPRNPHGRTGIEGRGLLGKWGPNFAVDPVVTRLNPVNEKLELILVKRADTGEWGLPGTIIIDGETWRDAALRALTAKTYAQLDFEKADIIAQVYVDDYRNTDNAWMESYAVHLHLTPRQLKNIHLKEGEGHGVEDVAWVQISPEAINSLFANHSLIIKKTLEKLLENGDVKIDKQLIRNTVLQI